jgi:hypothetical protein
VEKPFPLWEVLIREAVMHLHSTEFREEFYGLIRNDEIYIRLYSLHLFLLAEKLKTSGAKLSSFDSYSSYFEFRKAVIILNTPKRLWPLHFYQFSYQGFHDHLP